MSVAKVGLIDGFGGCGNYEGEDDADDYYK